METKEKVLALLQPLGTSQEVIITCSPFDIGRSRTAALIIPNVNVSRYHCQLIYSREHVWILKDMSSTGTFINDKLIGKGNSVVLKDNETIRLGPIDCNFVWKFLMKTDYNPHIIKECSPSITIYSQAITEIFNEKNSLQRQIILNKESYIKMKIKEDELQQQCLSQRNQSDEIDYHNGKQVEGGKNIIENDKEKELINLRKKMNDSSNTEEALKMEIQKLQQKLISEKLQWENKLAEESRRLEEKICEQNARLAIEKSRITEMSSEKDQQVEQILRRGEQEKQYLMERLQEMEQGKYILLQKLKESDEFHASEMARLEENMQKAFLEKEENIKTNLQVQIDALEEKQRHDNELKAKFEEEERKKNQNLKEELDQVKSTLIETESEKKLLEREFSSLKDEVTKAKSSILENIADLMETELQCSICSELLITATTLNCTHTFCKYCIDKWKKKKKDCPICRQKIIHYNRSIVMDNYIEKMIENLSAEVKDKRKAVIAERKSDEQCKKKKLSSLPCENGTPEEQGPSGSNGRGGNSRSRNRRRSSRN